MRKGIHGGCFCILRHPHYWDAFSKGLESDFHSLPPLAGSVSLTWMGVTVNFIF